MGTGEGEAQRAGGGQLTCILRPFSLPGRGPYAGSVPGRPAKQVPAGEQRAQDGVRGGARAAPWSQGRDCARAFPAFALLAGLPLLQDLAGFYVRSLGLSRDTRHAPGFPSVACAFLDISSSTPSHASLPGAGPNT